MRCFSHTHLSAALAAILLSACGAPTPAAPSASSNATILPLRTLRLYETGVGYFERSGTIDGRSATSLPVPAGHLDDALTSLVVLNGGAGGAISGVSFTSSVTKATARARAGLPADPSTPIAFRDLLDSMKGEKVSIVARGEKERLVGRVIEVTLEPDEARARALAENKAAKPDETPTHVVVTLLSDTGDVASVPSDSILRIRPVDPAFAARLDAALDALGKRSSQTTRAMSLLGGARGTITFGYVAETPIWRASYRLIEGVRAEGGAIAATLQGWALVHNDTDENWHDVHLELVNGEPDSFVFPMAAPRYARRELVHPENPLSTLPQLQDTTADALWGDHVDRNYSPETLGHGSGTGGGYGVGHMTRAPTVRMGQTRVGAVLRESELLHVGNLAELAHAAGIEQGAQFVYAAAGGISLEARASALVPFVARSVSVENVTLFASVASNGRTAERFVNTTGQTLPAGTITVFGAGGFLGETALDRLKPGEQRFLSIGNDLDSHVAELKVNQSQESKRLSFANDTLSEHFLQTTENTWELENRAATPRALYVALSANRNAKITGVDRVDYDEETQRGVVVFSVKAQQKAKRTFSVVQGLSRALELDALTENSVRALMQKTTIATKDLATLGQALPRVQALEAAHAQAREADKTVASSQEALERLREDLKALGGGGAATAIGANPLVKRVVEAEDRVEGARKSHETAEKTLDERRDALRVSLKTLAVDTTE